MKSSRIQTYFAVALFMLLALPGIAQKMSVANFYLAETDLTANTEGTIVYDQNGDKCALIKVETTQRGFTFDGGSLGIAKVEEHPGEIWLYVPHGLKRLTISHPQLGILRNHDLGLSVQKARTYILQLTTDKVLTAVFDDTQTQMLELTVSPSNAEVIINGMRETPDENGRIVRKLSFGSYNCRVLAENYHTYEGTITINDPNSRHIVHIALKQAFGYLQIMADDNDFEGAEVYIDDNKVGTLPMMERMPIRSGTHKVTISNPLYLPFESNVTIQDSSVYQLRPDKLVSNHAMVTVEAAADATVWIDNENKGIGTWRGPLTIGNHVIECRKNGHRSTSKQVNIASTNAVTFSCEPPQPIYGALHATSVPSDADVYIDGEKVGTTPFLTQTVLIGEHNIQFVKDGYKSEERTIVVNEGESRQLSVELSNFCNIHLTSTPSLSMVYLNNEYKGVTPLNIQTVSGMHDLRLQKEGYTDYHKNVRLDASSSNMHVKLRRNHIKRNEFYVGAAYRMNALTGIEYGVGCYISNINMEFGIITSGKESDKVYWYRDGSEAMPTSTTYDIGGYSARIGYGFRLGNRMRLTPQLGINHVVLKENTENDDYYTHADGAYSTKGVVALNLDWALGSWLKLSLAPEYSVPMSKSDGYKTLNSIIDIEKLSSGFSMKLGAYLYF